MPQFKSYRKWSPKKSHRPGPWWAMFVLVLVLPALGLLQLRLMPESVLRISLYLALVAAPLLIMTALMMSRLRSLIGALGLERLTIIHRVLGLATTLVVVLHVTFVVLGDPRHAGILALQHQPRQVWAGVVATLGLGLLVVLALLRRGQRPRYEGWHLAHVVLALVIIASSGLHVLWLDQLWHRPVMKLTYGGLLLITILVLTRRWLWSPWRLRRRPYAVKSVEALPGDAIRLVVQAHEHTGFSFKAGQFAWLKIGESPHVFEDHPFSFSSTASNTQEKEFIVKGLGDFSQLLVGLRPGRLVYLDGPYGRFVIEKLGRSAGLVFVAGGAGITPILSMLRTLAETGFDQLITVVVVSRSVETAMALDQVTELGDRLKLNQILLVEKSPLVAVPTDWRLEVGVLRGVVVHRFLPKVGAGFHDYFVCGSPRLVQSMTELLKQRNVPAPRIHTEQFDSV